MINSSGAVVALSVSEIKGTSKTNVYEALVLPDWGILGDAHAGKWHRQISLLALESINKMIELGAKVNSGSFAENITTQGIELTSLKIGDRLQIGDVILEITQLGKKCHNRCAIYQQVGDCVMPQEGIFARVVSGGILTQNMTISVIRTVSFENNLFAFQHFV